MSPASPAATCANPEVCAAEFQRIDRDITDLRAEQRRLDERQRTQGEALSALRAQVAAWAAFGSLVGGGAVTIIAKLLKV